MLFAEHITDHEAAITSSCISSLNRRKQLPQAIIRIDQGNEVFYVELFINKFFSIIVKFKFFTNAHHIQTLKRKLIYVYHH